MKVLTPLHLFTFILLTFLFFLKDYGTTLLIDIPSRANLNLFYSDNAYLFWTSFSYIYRYFIPAILILYISANIPMAIYLLPLQLVFILLVTLSILPMLISSNVFLQPWYFSIEPNTLLLNSINKYHPLLLYISFFGVISSYFIDNSYYRYHKPVISIPKSNNFIILFFVVSFTMFLGSWWAYQEGSWGGWWAWDPSETLGLLIFFVLVYIKHSSYIALPLIKINFKSKFSMYLLFSTYLFLQANFGLTSHDFGMRGVADLAGRQLYVTLIFLLMLFSPRIIFFKKYIHVLLNPFSYIGTYLKIRYYVSQALILLLLSLVPLLTDLIWKITSVQFSNFQVKYWLVILVINVSIFLFLSPPALNVGLILLLLSTLVFLPPYVFVLYALLAIRNGGISYFFSIHANLFIFLLASIISNLTSVCTFSISTAYLDYSSSCFFFETPFYGIDNFYTNHKISGVVTLLDSTFNISSFIILFSTLGLNQNFIFYLSKLSGISIVLDTLTIWVLNTIYLLATLTFIVLRHKCLISC
jgi:cytochrome c biogenesis factor